MGKYKPYLILFWKDSVMYIALVLHPTCVPEKVGTNQKRYSYKR
jgi:hypothetical protein